MVSHRKSKPWCLTLPVRCGTLVALMTACMIADNQEMDVSISGTTLSKVGASVTYVATVRGGTKPYSYSQGWQSAGSSTATRTVCLTQPGSAVISCIASSSGSLQATNSVTAYWIDVVVTNTVVETFGGSAHISDYHMSEECLEGVSNIVTASVLLRDDVQRIINERGMGGFESDTAFTQELWRLVGQYTAVVTAANASIMEHAPEICCVPSTVTNVRGVIGFAVMKLGGGTQSVPVTINCQVYENAAYWLSTRDCGSDIVVPAVFSVTNQQVIVITNNPLNYVGRVVTVNIGAPVSRQDVLYFAALAGYTEEDCNYTNVIRCFNDNAQRIEDLGDYIGLGDTAVQTILDVVLAIPLIGNVPAGIISAVKDAAKLTADSVLKYQEIANNAQKLQTLSEIEKLPEKDPIMGVEDDYLPNE